MAERDYLADISDLATLADSQTDDPKLKLALKRASDRFVASIGWDPSYEEDDSLVLDGTGGDTLLLPVLHVTEINEVRIGEDTATDWTVNKEAGILRRSAYWPDELGAITVVCSHGWQETPGAITDAVLEQAETQYRAITGIQSYSLGGRSVTFGSAASIGVTQKWSDAVRRYSLGGRA
jgi:hypothetical protein